MSTLSSPVQSLSAEFHAALSTLITKAEQFVTGDQLSKLEESLKATLESAFNSYVADAEAKINALVAEAVKKATTPSGETSAPTV